MPDLRRELEFLAAEVEYPATPDLAASVRPALHRRRRIVFVPRRRVLALAALFVLLAAGTVFAAVPSARHAVLEFFHLRGATVERRTELPSATPNPPSFGDRVTLAQAQSRVGFPVLVPARYGEPDAVYLRGAEVSLEYRRPRRLLVSEFRGDTDPDYVGKIAGTATRVQRLTLGG